MAHPLPRMLAARERLEDERRLARILLESGDEAPDAATVSRAQHHDPARMRGIPIVGRSGYGGAIAGTDPLRELLRK